MSWEDILKKESGLEFLLDDIHPSYNEKPVQEESVDFSESEDFCCGKAKNQILEIFTMRVERIKRSGRVGLQNALQNIDILDTMDCDDLKGWLRKEVEKLNKPAPKGKKHNSELLALKEILEEWDKCEG